MPAASRVLTPQATAPYTFKFQRLTHGPVAQLGARMNGIHEVTGSIPVRSTNLRSREPAPKPEQP